MLFLDSRKELVEEELRVGGRDAVVFVAAVEARQSLVTGRWHHTGLDEDADPRWNILFGDEIVEDDGSLVNDTVLKNHEGRRLGLVETRQQINLVFAPGAGKNAALLCGVGILEQRVLWDVGLRLGVLGKGKLRFDSQCQAGKEKECEDQAHAAMLTEAAKDRQSDFLRDGMNKTPMPSL